MFVFIINLISKSLAVIFAMGFYIGIISSNLGSTSMCHWPTTVQKYAPGFLLGCKMGDIINKEKQ